MNKINKDLFRFNRKRGFFALLDTALRKREFRYMLYFRWYQSGMLHFLARIMLRSISNKTNIQIGWKTRLGGGFVIVHPGSIAVNNEASIGNNCTIYHGATVGMEFRGKRRGNPVIGDRVWIGPNATIVGNVSIGDDVLVAPSAFVNFDVPSHSIVIGNPGRIMSKDNASESYITNCDY